MLGLSLEVLLSRYDMVELVALWISLFEKVFLIFIFLVGLNLMWFHLQNLGQIWLKSKTLLY